MKKEFHFDCTPTPPVKGELRFKKLVVTQERWHGYETLKKESKLQQFDGTDWHDVPEESQYIYV